MNDRYEDLHPKMTGDDMMKLQEKDRSAEGREKLVHIETSDENEKKVWSKYLFKKIIGKGGFSIVISLYEKKTGRVVAAKVVDKVKISGDTVRLLQEEPVILRSLDHQNIVSLIDYVESQKRIFILLDYMDGGDLSKYIKERKRANNPFKEHEVQGVLLKLLHALNYLHGRGIIHRDIKPGSLG